MLPLRIGEIVDVNIDLTHPANRADPFPAFRWLRENDPVHWSEGLRMWVVTRFDDVHDVVVDATRFSVDRFRNVDPGLMARRPDMREVANILKHWAVYRDPPDHTRLRSLLGRAFTVRVVEKMRPRVQEMIDELLDRLEEVEQPDFIRDFAFPLPAAVIATMLGTPRDDIATIKVWSDQVAQYVGGARGSGATIEEARQGLLRLHEYFRELVAARRRARRDDLISLMLEAEESGQMLSEEEVASNCVLLMFAGHETTTNLLGNGLYHLVHHPAELSRLRCRPELVADAVEEILRYDAPVSGTIRIAVQDVELNGRRIEAGQTIAAFLAAANRDPSQFRDPESFDVGRHPNRHLSFGYATHFCLGAALARLEANAAFGALVQRYGVLDLAGEPERNTHIFFSGFKSLPVRVVPRPGAARDAGR